MTEDDFYDNIYPKTRPVISKDLQYKVITDIFKEIVEKCNEINKTLTFELKLPIRVVPIFDEEANDHFLSRKRVKDINFENVDFEYNKELKNLIDSTYSTEHRPSFIRGIIY